MSEESGYHGYKNYETWCAALWMDDEVASYGYWLEVAKEADGDIGELAGRMKDEYDEAMPEVNGMWSDLLTAVFGEIDWYEIAEAKIKEVAENAKAEIRAMIEVGPTSSGSMKLEDIVEGVRDLLPDKLLHEFDMYEPLDPDDNALQMCIFEEICDYLSEVAPDGVSFGASEGDGACYGFFRDEEERE